MNETQLLEDFAGADSEAARCAADALFAACRPLLRHCLRESCVRIGADPEDLIQDTFCKLWLIRLRFRNEGMAAFRAFATSTAQRCLIDLYRDLKRKGETGGDAVDVETVPDDDLDTVVSVMLGIEARGLHQLADEIFLGLDPAVPSRTRDRQLLAAQLYYLDGEPWKEVQRTLPPASGEPPLTRELLDRWLADEGVLCSLAYGVIYYSNDRLAACLLGLPETVDEQVLNRLLRDGAALADWSAPEVAVILWRYRYAMTLDHITSRQDCAYTPEELCALIDRLRARLPFNHQMTRLLAGFDCAPQLEARTMLRTPGLWQRLALAYRFDDELPHLDIHERVQPAAQVVGHSVTMGMLNVWLSNGRLVKRLADAYRETIKDDEND